MTTPTILGMQTIANSTAAAVDGANSRLAALLNDKTKSAGQLMAEMNVENGVTSFAQGLASKTKDDNKFPQRLA